MTVSLAERLKSETRGLHVGAERSAFMRRLLQGRLPRLPYCDLLRNLHEVYGSLEPALAAQASHPALAPLYSQHLSRRDSLASDLDSLHGPGWSSALTPRPATRRYVQRLEVLRDRQPERLAAHAYVRYLGDLSGGQMLARIVSNSFGLPPGHGTRFYDFGGPDAVRERIDAFRGGLAALPADAELADALVDEARLAFRLHHQLFDELAARHDLGVPAPLSPGS